MVDPCKVGGLVLAGAQSTRAFCMVDCPLLASALPPPSHTLVSIHRWVLVAGRCQQKCKA